MSANITMQSNTALTAALSSFLAPKAANQALATENGAKASSKPVSARVRKSGTLAPTTSSAFASKAVRAMQTALAEQAATAKRIGAMPAAEVKLISVTHSHYCKHCNRSYSCISNPCVIPQREISKLHKCNEAKIYRKRMATMLSNEDTICLYGCTKVCNHPIGKVSDTKTVNPMTSRYSIDGMSNQKEVIVTQKQWYKAKLNKVSDTFNDTPWLVSLAKDFRNN